MSYVPIADTAPARAFRGAARPVGGVYPAWPDPWSAPVLAGAFLSVQQSC